MLSDREQPFLIMQSGVNKENVLERGQQYTELYYFVEKQ